MDREKGGGVLSVNCKNEAAAAALIDFRAGPSLGPAAACWLCGGDRTGRTAKHAGMGQLAASGFHSVSDGEKSSHYGSDRLGECKPIRSSSVRTVHSTEGHPGTGLFPAGNDGRGLGAGGKDQCLEPAAGKAPDPGDQSEKLENQFDAVGPAGLSP